MVFAILKRDSFYIFLGLILFLLTACRGNKGKETDIFNTPGAEYEDYIVSFTSGVISRATPIYIRFANDIVANEETGKEIAPLIEFSPSIKGKTTWENSYTLRFEPEAWLPGNKKYTASINLKPYFSSIPDNLATFKFAFRVMQQDVEIEVLTLKEENLGNLDKLILNGVLHTADAAKPEDVQAMLKVEQKDNEALLLSWQHQNEMKRHVFQVQHIARAKGDKDGELLLHWDGSKIGLKKKGTEKVVVPNPQFKVMKVEMRQEEGADPYISIQLSKPVAPELLLEKGMIALEEKEYQYGSHHYSNDNGFTLLSNGSEIKCFVQVGRSGKHILKFSDKLKSIEGNSLQGEKEFEVDVRALSPAVKVIGKGVIIPQTKGLYFPFDAVNLKAIDVEIFKIYENNILAFLESSNIDETYYMRHVGRIVMQKRVMLQEINPQANLARWTRYALDLDELIKKEPGAIYQVRIAFRREYAAYNCVDAAALQMKSVSEIYQPDEESGEYESIYEGQYYYSEYKERNNPCSNAYYNSDRFIKRNILASNLGIIAKRARNKEMLVVVTDLLTAKPLSGAQIQVYDNVKQPLATVTTGSDGSIKFQCSRQPFMVVAKYGQQKGYLRVKQHDALSLSRFDVSGSSVTDYKGIKGMLYGERGVWRPGDSLFLTVVLESRQEALPLNYPVTLELYNPNGQMVEQRTVGQHLNGMYKFHLATATKAPTGDWTARVKAGGLEFSENLKIETVKPNRLKIKLDFHKNAILSSDFELKGDLKVNWLHGTPAKNLKTKVDVALSQQKTDFENYKDFVFDDPTRRDYRAEPFTLYEAEVNDKGEGKVNGTLKLAAVPAGKMRASFTVRAYETGGEFSVDNFSLPLSPFEAYIGLQIPKNQYGYKELTVQETGKIRATAVDEKGKPLAGRKLRVGLYRLDWSWWYDGDNENLSKYNSGYHVGALQTAEIRSGADGSVDWEIKPEEWGRYLVRVCDEVSGHCTGDFFYAGSPWDDGDFGNKSEASMLVFATDKEVYQTGEEVELKIPGGKSGRALISLETGRGLLEHFWADLKDNKGGIQTVKFKTTAAMSPTVYAHVSLIQPHGKAENDLPIRAYGVIPIRVENPESRLQPLVDMPEVLKPNTKVKIQVKEEKGRPMTYTIAMVDEGLLDLTRFKTPDLWSHFYKRDALQVSSWDIYDYVLGVYGVALDRIIAVGGDGYDSAADAKKANRFKPMVRFLGPFTVAKGKTAVHEVSIPNYIGSVRTMVVAAQDAAYGKAEKTTPVRQPLMVLATLPRVLSPEEEMALPVTIFAMEDHVKEVTVELKTNNGLELKGNNKKTIRFEQKGDAVTTFDVKVAAFIGVAKVEVIATSGKERAVYTIEVEVRNPNPRMSKNFDVVLDPGKAWSMEAMPVGMQGTNSGILELSVLPPIDFGKRLNYLVRYPYGCIEQTVSAVFPQLYVGNLIQLTQQQKLEIDINIKAAIRRIAEFQTASGGFGYWPGSTESSEWGSNYAGHFLLEAQAKGYPVPKDLLANWVTYQRSLAKIWRAPRENDAYPNENAALIQTYRLYTLALSKNAELASMNLLVDSKTLPLTAKWRLAAAYALTGNTTTAKRLTDNLGTEVKPYKELSYTYGSDLRDEAMILETLVLLGERNTAADVVRRLSSKLSKEEWYATQTTAYTLLAIAKFAGNNLGKPAKFSFTVGKNNKQGQLDKQPIFLFDLTPDKIGKQLISVKNEGETVLFARVLLEGQPLQGDTTEFENDLKFDISYQTLGGKKLDPTAIQQGTDFVALVKVSNPGKRGKYEEMALHQVFPSGWEIINTRMYAAFSQGTNIAAYQDIRDDRVYTFFDLGAAQSKTYKVFLSAAYAGRFYMPNQSCEAMYDHSIYANKAGKWVEVTTTPKVQ